MSPSLGLLDGLRLALGALRGNRLRSGLSLVGVVVGVAAVILLSALGSGARSYVVDQFSSLGSNLVIVVPGYTETTGLPGIGGTPRDLSIADALALARGVRSAQAIAPLVVGTESVAHAGLSRQVALLGTSREYFTIRELRVARGQPLPLSEWNRGSPVVVLGSTTAEEIFPAGAAVGQTVRVGGWRLRVIGVLAPQGTTLGVNADEVAIVPVATAMQMLNRSSLFRILIQAGSHLELNRAREEALEILIQRHGVRDVTIVTQDALVSTFGRILETLTLVVASIASISLAVAGIVIMNVMLVTVSERGPEIGLLKALGAGRTQILSLFLAESAMLSLLGGALGVALGWLATRVLVVLYPAFPAQPPPWSIVAALTTALLTGTIFGLLPARRAAEVDPARILGSRG